MSIESSFVVASGTQFSLDGNPFPVAGANNYYLGFASDTMVRSVFDLAVRKGLNTLRAWAFLDCGAALPGSTPADAWDGVFFQYLNAKTGQPEFNDGPNGLERLDRTICLAEQNGVRLILPLVNYWDDFGGMNRYLAWFGLTGRHQFYRHPSLKDAYRRYVEHLILRVNTRTGRRYRDEPSILAWELANEPRCTSDDGNPLADGGETLVAWADEMSSFIKSLDPNHLVGVGDEGYFRRRYAFGNRLYDGSSGVDTERFLELPAIDFGTCHLYPAYAPANRPEKFGARWIREHIEAGHRAGKPMLIEEYGIKSGTETNRDDVYETWLAQVTASGGAGAMVWMIAGVGHDGQPYPDYDGYTVCAPGRRAPNSQISATAASAAAE